MRDKKAKSEKVIRSRPSKPAGAGKRARRKGHNYERSVVKFFKDLGYDQAKTSRLGSRLLDSAKVDICDIPFNVKCKAVEANIDYHKLTDEVKTELEKLMPQREKYPIIIFHKRNKKTNVILTIEQFRLLMQSVVLFAPH